MDGLTAHLHDEGQGDIRHFRGGKLLLGLLGSLADAHHRGGILRQVSAVRTHELAAHPLHDALVEVIAAQVVVAAGGQHLDHAVADLDDGHIKRTAAQVIDHDLLGRAVVEAVSQGRAGGLVDDAADVQPRDAARVLGGLALNVIEIGGHGDDRVGDLLAQVGFRVLAELAQDHRADLLGIVHLAAQLLLPVGAHVTLDGGHGAPCVHRRLAFRCGADQPLAAVGEGHHAGGGALALVVGDDGCHAALHHGDAAVGGAKINTDYFTHG